MSRLDTFLHKTKELSHTDSVLIFAQNRLLNNENRDLFVSGLPLITRATMIKILRAPYKVMLCLGLVDF